MNLLRSRVEQLAEHLRDQILHGQLAEPLPNTRDWSKQLHVGRRTICSALQILEQEGLLTRNTSNAYQLQASRITITPGSVRKLVRGIIYWPDYRGHHNSGGSTTQYLAERLHSEHIEVRTERWSDSHFRNWDRMRPLLATPTRELFLLPGLPQKHLSMFVRAAKPCLMLNLPVTPIDLPFIACDWNGAIRHATFYLARRRFERIAFVVRKTLSPHVERYCETFMTSCRLAPHGPVQGEILQPNLSVYSQVSVAARLAARIKGRMGIIIEGPLAISGLMTTLLRHGIRIPQQVEIVFVNSLPDQLVVDPLPVHYPYPLETLVKTIAQFVIQYFETGRLPRLHKLIPVELISPRATG